MKRLHGAAVLAAAAMFTASMGITGMADTSGAGENGSRLDGMVCMDGSVISAEDGRLHLNRRVEGGMTEVVVNLSEDTKILDAVNGFPVSVENLDDGEAVRVYTGPAMILKPAAHHQRASGSGGCSGRLRLSCLCSGGIPDPGAG